MGSLRECSVGKQLIRSADSVAANLAEGYGRFHFNENRQFAYYARGSLYETMSWLTKAANRKLIDNEYITIFKADFNKLGCMLNAYLKSIGSRPTQVKEIPYDWPLKSTNDQ